MRLWDFCKEICVFFLCGLSECCGFYFDTVVEAFGIVPAAFDNGQAYNAVY